MKKFSNNLYRALKLLDASDILGSDFISKSEEETSCQEVALWYLILDYHLQWLDEARDDEMDAVKEKFRELYRMMPKIYRSSIHTDCDVAGVSRRVRQENGHEGDL